METHILRRIELRLAGANWQRGGGKGKRPEPFPLPGDKQHQRKPVAQRGADAITRLRNLGLVPAAAGRTPTPEELRREAEDLFLASEQRLATES